MSRWWDINRWWDLLVCAVAGHALGEPEFDMSRSKITRIRTCRRCGAEVDA